MLVEQSTLALQLAWQVRETASSFKLWHDDFFDDQRVEVRTAKVVVSLVVKHGELALNDSYERHIERPTAKVVNKPSAVAKIDVLLFVCISQARRDRLLKEHDRLEASHRARLPGRVALYCVKRGWDSDNRRIHILTAVHKGLQLLKQVR